MATTAELKAEAVRLFDFQKVRRPLPMLTNLVVAHGLPVEGADIAAKQATLAAILDGAPEVFNKDGAGLYGLVAWA